MNDRTLELHRAEEVASQFAERVYSRAAPVRVGFVSRYSSAAPVPPLIQMLRGGRGGKVRAALYLSVLWAGSAYPHDVAMPARAWALLLGLPEPETNGVRRIRAGFGWLEEHQYIRTFERPGLPAVVRPLDESGSGESYRHPGILARELRETGQPIPIENRYFQVPASIWTTGLAAQLSGPGLAMLLVLLQLTRTGAREGVWLSPAHARARFGLSNDTRISGLQELVGLDVVAVRRQVVDQNPFEVHRLRNTYTFERWALGRPRDVDTIDEVES